MPDGVQNRKPPPANALGLADPPVVLSGFGETVGPGFDLGAALLLEPVQPPELLEVARQQIAQGRQMPDVQRGIVEKLGRQRPPRPVCLLAVLVELDPEMILQKRGQPDPLATQQLRRQHRVEKALRPEAAEVVEQPEVEIAPVHDQVLLGQTGPERLQVEVCEDIHEVDIASHQELEQADPHPVVEHVVGFGIQGDFLYAVDRG